MTMKYCADITAALFIFFGDIIPQVKSIILFILLLKDFHNLLVDCMTKAEEQEKLW